MVFLVLPFVRPLSPRALKLQASGRPGYEGSWVDQVNWISGDVFYANWDEVLVGATAVVSTLGGFGSEEQMLRIKGKANAVAVGAAQEYGIPKFILISVHDYHLPPFLLSSGYFTGKRKADSEALSKYPHTGDLEYPFSQFLVFFRSFKVQFMHIWAIGLLFVKFNFWSLSKSKTK
ncbi:uncharacterized protein At1g32220, chloroplastic-like [Mangifera indica]|uniref:uncharacterized protein At1g32220, chloroplastic-like n=1 Tax=Mangifera indica TaxID=29780 RepID=UPI001CF9FF0F|nr:uncharacterized protein At1g32220, chloroplastic-like [Mangifera indica]